MCNQDINIKGGVIIIGSLLWQNNLNGSDNLREKWRDTYLDMQKKVLVKLPIRYGRYSSKSSIYTMVFSNNCEKNKTLGTGYVVPFKRNPIQNIETILSEAEKMSEAEGMKKNFIAGNREKWGVMAIIFNKEKLSNGIIKRILEKWKHKYNGSIKFFKEYRIGQEKRILSKNGELQIKWPEPVVPGDVEKINKLDFLIASVTKPKHKDGIDKYPSILEIANSIINDSERKYFYNNFFNGIITFQDIKIINKI